MTNLLMVRLLYLGAHIDKPTIDPRASLFVIFVLLASITLDNHIGWTQRIKNRR